MPLSPRDIEPALSLWPELAGGRARLINHSENQTFLVETERRGRFTLRVHRPGYQSRPAIESELAWMAALRRDTDVPIPEPLPGADGQLADSEPQHGGGEGQLHARVACGEIHSERGQGREVAVDGEGAEPRAQTEHQRPR